ncbi:MAG: hypothetical protein HYS44_03670 [Candidatus Niyogibacteria bacterium]|nr:hypothetical protein [Candidatus Niyogibacteria bacterium]
MDRDLKHYLNKQFGEIRKKLKEHDAQFVGIRSKLREHDTRFKEINTQFKEINMQFIKIDEKFDILTRSSKRRNRNDEFGFERSESD